MIFFLTVPIIIAMFFAALLENIKWVRDLKFILKFFTVVRVLAYLQFIALQIYLCKEYPNGYAHPDVEYNTPFLHLGPSISLCLFLAPLIAEVSFSHDIRINDSGMPFPMQMYIARPRSLRFVLVSIFISLNSGTLGAILLMAACLSPFHWTFFVGIISLSIYMRGRIWNTVGILDVVYTALLFENGHSRKQGELKRYLAFCEREQTRIQERREELDRLKKAKFEEEAEKKKWEKWGI